WTHTDSSQSTFERRGDRQADRDLRGQIDGLMRQGSDVLAGRLTNLALTGRYTTTGTATTTTTLAETGSVPGIITRDYEVKQTATTTTTSSNTAVNTSISQVQTVRSESTIGVRQGKIDMATGDYTVTVNSKATNTILNQTETNQTLNVTMTGG